MDVKSDINGNAGTLYIEEKGIRIAFMKLLFREKNRLVIDQTEVRPGFEGKGLGKLLVDAAVDLARERGYKIIPVCPYAKKILFKTNEFSDVL